MKSQQTDALRLTLNAGREKPVLHGHPWIFEGALRTRPACGPEGAPAEVFDAGGTWLGRGLLTGSGALAVRLLTRNPDEPLDDALFADRARRAWQRRQRIWEREPGARARTDAWRLVHAEADGLPGIVADLYNDVLSLRVGCAAMQRGLPAVIDTLRSLTGAREAVVQADSDTAGREALDAEAFAALGTAPAAQARIRENGLQFDVDCGSGQKTGFFVDQRDNRARVAAYARGADVLGVYCYTGAFEAGAAAAGAKSILAIDRSAAALERAEANFALNGLETPVRFECADAPTALRGLRDRAQSFDLIVLDPPRLVGSEAQRPKGMRAYKDINLLGIKLLRPGGILASFSCSGLVSADDLLRAIAFAAADAGRTVRVLETLGQPPDHPVPLAFPEAGYLKGFIAEVE